MIITVFHQVSPVCTDTSLALYTVNTEYVAEK